jgi:hypothetical protein
MVLKHRQTKAWFFFCIQEAEMKDEGGLLNHDFIVEGSKPYRDQPAIYFLIHGGQVVYVGKSFYVNGSLRGLDTCPSRTCLAGDDGISQLRTVGDSEMTADAFPLLGGGTTAASAENQPSDSPRVSKRHWRYRKSESEIA